VIFLQIHIANLFPGLGEVEMNRKLEAEHFPRAFSIAVPRFYPHDKPIVYIMEGLAWAHREPWAGALDVRHSDGRLHHPLLMDDWNATMGFTQAVRSIILSSQHLLTQPQTLQAWPSPSRPPASPFDGQGDGGPERADDGVLNCTAIAGSMEPEHSTHGDEPANMFEANRRQGAFAPPLRLGGESSGDCGGGGGGGGGVGGFHVDADDSSSFRSTLHPLLSRPSPFSTMHSPSPPQPFDPWSLKEAAEDGDAAASVHAWPHVMARVVPCVDGSWPNGDGGGDFHSAPKHSHHMFSSAASAFDRVEMGSDSDDDKVGKSPASFQTDGTFSAGWA
jgi:hypothetical protein